MYHTGIIQTIILIQIEINAVLIEKNHDDEHNKKLNLIQMHYLFIF